jgi:hypothetical protein
MALFRKKKVGKPRNPLGRALYAYDFIIKKDLRRIIKGIKAKKRLNPRKTNIILEDVFGKFEVITHDISKENLKVDYRSDKIRYIIIDMINRLKALFERAGKDDFDQLRLERYKTVPELDDIESTRENLKKKMKEIESDYL